MDPQRLADALAAMAPPLARAKGLVRDATGRLQVIQVVGRRACVEPAPSNATGTGRLVVICAGEPLDRDAVHAVLQAARAPDDASHRTQPA